jgi:hypothetical protein
LSTIFATAVAAYTTSHTSAHGLDAAAAIHGYTVAFAWAAGIFALGLMLALLILPPKPKPSAASPRIAADDATGAAAKHTAPAAAALMTHLE